jgi:DNA-binding GntR family transcriptional regulator
MNSSTSQAIDRSTTADRLADALRTLMFDGELGAGEPLREIQLASMFSVSRSTVREALYLLASEGLVTRLPNKGAVVTQLTEDDVAEIFMARTVLETAGIRHRQHAADGDLAALAAAMDDYQRDADSPDQNLVTQRHLAVHCGFVALLGNRRLLNTATGLTNDLRLVLAGVNRAEADAQRQVAAHRSLVDLIVAGQASDAAVQLTDHLRQATSSVLRRSSDTPDHRP